MIRRVELPRAAVAPTDSTTVVRIDGRTWLAAMVITLVGLVAASIFAKWIARTLDPEQHRGWLAVVDKFDLNGEMNLPGWYGSVLLLTAAAVLAVIAAGHRTRGEAYRWWLVLAFLFLGLSIEETAAVKDFFTPPLRRMLGLGGPLYFAWVIPGALFVLAMGLIFLRFLIRLDVRTRIGFFVAGTVYVGGALGMELVGGYLTDTGGQATLAYLAATTTEESLEMLGVVIFIYALSDYIRRRLPALAVGLRSADAASPPASIR
jgi:hypothetical protein